MNNLQVRDTNRNRILNFLYSNDRATKQNIAEALRLSMPTVSLILKDFEKRGLVTKSGTLKSSGGRKPMTNSLDYGARLSCGIEITQKHLRFVIIDLGENVLYYKRTRQFFRSEDTYFQTLADNLTEFLNESHVDPNKLLGIGIAVPGLVNPASDILEYSPTLHVKNLPIDSMKKYLPYPVQVDNEANLAGFAEIWKMDETKNAVYLSINKGVGGAIITNNQLYSGANGHSGEFGHMTIVRDGLPCSCGKKGCFEAYCSTKVLTEPNFDDIEGFFDALETENQHCRQKWETYLDYLSTGINNIRIIFDSDIIIGGEISQYIQKYSDVLVNKLRLINSFGGAPDYLHFSRFNDKASAIGAALLHINSFLNS
ncbi:MAG: ROK family transcriptional regulator [Oscillospiraceae bacterium]|nr:ROK family transcriptional regulator [Oscillospiraceae bacterium]